MRLKIFTTALFIFGMVLLLGWPLVMGPVPKHGTPRKEIRGYIVKASYYVGAMVVTLMATSVCAVIIVRRARNEYREEAMANMRILLESTRADHARKKQNAEEEA